MSNDLISLLKKANNSQIHLAGPRYTPLHDSTAPNLKIESLDELFEYLVISEKAVNELTKISNELKNQYTKKKKEFSDLIIPIQPKLRRLNTILGRLAKTNDNQRKILIKELKTVSQHCSSSIQDELKRLYGKSNELKEHSQERHAVESKIYALREFSDAVEAVVSLSNSSKLKLLYQKKLLLLGEWGTGKTHLLCDISKKKIEHEWPIIFMLAHKIDGYNDPFQDYIKCKNLDTSTDSFLKALNNLARKKGIRGLIIIDGVNEGNKKAWSKFLRILSNKIEGYKHISFVISCRTPFEHLMFSKRFMGGFVKAYHEGFSENEFDAQLEFFTYYKIPTPNIPLLSHEFSRPLFLKVICESLKGLSKRVKKKEWYEIINGQKSFTHILEQFIKEVSSSLVNKHKLPVKFYWFLIKDNKKKSISSIMADNGRKYIFNSELISLLKEREELDYSNYEQHIDEMLSAGILSEDIVGYGQNQETVYRLPYEKFSDHIIARHLLDKIDYSKYSQIKYSFYSNQAQGFAFVVDKYGRYNSPSIAEALMLEFPERLKNVSAKEYPKELYFWLPKKNRAVEPFVDVFVDGLYWRASSSFSKDTRNIVNAILKNFNGYKQYELLEALTSIATRAHHPWNAQKLYLFISKLSLKERDLFWNEYIRNAYPSSVVYKIPLWLEKNPNIELDEEENRNLIILMSLFLGTTDKNIRDQYTKGLVLLGCRHPKNLFSHTLRSFKLNDPYIIERMLAASYGCILKLQRQLLQQGKLRESALTFANKLYKLFFIDNAPYYTTHHLTRSHAWGIFDILSKGNPPFPKEIDPKIYLPPFSRRSNIPPANRIKLSDVEHAKKTIQMDFENYTLGRLVSNRANYDFKNIKFKRARKRVLWRIIDLGYSSDEFGTVDAQISRSSWGRDNKPDKVERYGKKYSWIAYYELYGEHQDKKMLDDEQNIRRCSDCGIDPSFPVQPQKWKPSFPSSFEKLSNKTPEYWLKSGPTPEYKNIIEPSCIDGLNGEWVMLDGTLTEKDNDDREIFSFVRGLIVKNKDIDLLKEIVGEKDYLGNSFIPEPYDEYYTYAGEIPLSKNFVPYLRTTTNRIKRDFRTIELREEKLIKLPIPKAWYILADIMNGEHVPSLVDLLYSRGDGSDAVKEYLKKITVANKGLDKTEQINKENILRPPSKIEMSQGYIQRNDFPIVAKVDVEIPVHAFSWESIHSTQNQISGFKLPSIKILSDLNLFNSGHGFSFVDSKGNLAAFALEIDMGIDRTFPSNGVYLRKDLLIRYLKKSKASLVWVVWGERTVNTEIISEYKGDPNTYHKKIVVFKF
ncbi:TPA: hypothetical protein ACT9ME_001605 [Legionella pneumophila]